LPTKEELNSVYVNLKKIGVGGFASDGYWGSTQDGYGSVWRQFFHNGGQGSFGSKDVDEMFDDGGYDVRAVRAF
jgi:hypothetical protein